MDGFAKEMEKQKTQSGKKEVVDTKTLQIPENITTEFVGYENLETSSNVAFVHPDGDSLWIVTEQTSFYIESGGQVSDKGFVKIQDHTYPITGMYKTDAVNNPAIAIKITPKEKITVNVGNTVTCIIDGHKRANTAKNHTATHMLQAALVQILGPQVKQAGSYVDESVLRFDYTYHTGITKEQIQHVEEMVNIHIQKAIPVKTFVTSLDDAKQKGVTACLRKCLQGK